MRLLLLWWRRLLHHKTIGCLGTDGFISAAAAWIGHTKEFEYWTPKTGVLWFRFIFVFGIFATLCTRSSTKSTAQFVGMNRTLVTRHLIAFDQRLDQIFPRLIDGSSQNTFHRRAFLRRTTLMEFACQLRLMSVNCFFHNVGRTDNRIIKG